MLLQVESLEHRLAPAILTVGPGKMYGTLGAAAAQANDGDTIRIDPMTLSGAAAYAVWTDNNLIIEGAGPTRTVLDATGFSLPNRKGLFTITSSNVTVRNIEFMGAHDAAGLDKNWAGLRQEGDNLTVQNCFFHDNDDGILGGGSASSDVLVEYSEFAHNGFGDGLSHNMYISDIHSFTLRYSYTHDALAGHDVKSRAQTNTLIGNWIGATGSGSESYEINLPDGGTAYLLGNVIRQDAATGNSTIVDWGSENNGGANPSLGFYFINNTVVNDRSSGGTYVRLLGGVYPADVRLVNNLFAGSGISATTYSGPTAQQLNNLKVADPGFGNAGTRDYHLTSTATGAINQGSDPGLANGVDLEPAWQYLATAQRMPRTVFGSAIDLGAFEFASAPVNQAPTVATPAAATANPVTGTTTNLNVLGADDGGAQNLLYHWSTTGTVPAPVTFSTNDTNAARQTGVTFTKAGVYTFVVTIQDAAGLTTTSQVDVIVQATPTSLVVTPANVTLTTAGMQAFTGVVRDQFGTNLSPQPALTWTLGTGSVGSLSPTGQYAAPTAGGGQATVSVSGAGLTATASVTVNAIVIPAFQQASTSNGLVVMEAERFDANVSQGGKSWVVASAPAGFSGAGVMVTTPNTGVNQLTGFVSASPRLDFQVNFVKTGIHYVWIRGVGPTTSDDSVHIGLDGAAVATADAITGLPTKYGWVRKSVDGTLATLNVTTPGLHTVNLWMGEDGASVDKLLLTTAKAYAPSGVGPAQSRRTVGDGLLAAYYDNSNFTGAKFSRFDAQINWSWGTGAPVAGIGADTFSARWTGKIQPPTSGTYTFYVTSDDGVRLWVNGKLLINQWQTQGLTTFSGTITLKADVFYNLRLDYFDNTGNATIKLEWQSAGQPREVVPTTRLFST